MSDANRSSLRYVRETTAGTTPTNPAFQEIQVRTSSLKYTPQTVSDDQLRADEQIVDQNLVGYDVAGDIQARLTFGALDDLIESSLAGTWTKQPIVNVTAATTITTYVVTGATYAVGDMLFASGFAIPGNNGIKELSAATATVLTPVGGLTVETPPAGAKVQRVGHKFASGDVAAAASGLTCTAGDFTTLGLVVGGWINVGGKATGDTFASATTKGYVRISAIAAKVLTFDVIPTGWATDAGTGKTIKIWTPDYVRNAQTSTSYTFEREYDREDGSVAYEYFRGVYVGKWGFKLAPRDNVEASFEMMGLTASDVVATRGAAVFGGATTIGTPTTVAPLTSDVMNTSSNVAQVRVNGVTFAGQTAVTELNLQSDRGLRTREGIGSKAAIAIRRGRAKITCAITAYFENTNLINLIRQDARTSLDFGFIDPESDASYYVDLPRVKASDGTIDVGAVDTDITTPMTFQALRHESLGYTLHLARFNYIEP